MKTLHLVCNSHLDPVWQWDWDEGATAAFATFYSAVSLASKYDYIFCHNEVILYEYVEKYDKKLFNDIVELVKQGKWHIMGGWYCQPDCMVPSGESFIRQITLGREYFGEKFNSRPTVALNFDSFGHTRGLPQILKKTGYDSYLFCRPLPFMNKFIHGSFVWKGYDGSTVKALRQEDDTIYCSRMGYAKEDIVRKAGHYEDQDNIIILWGVGNHGGLMSDKDLSDIMVLQDEKKGEWEIIHSTPEAYFAAEKPTQTWEDQITVFVKSYSSVSSIKQGHDRLENALYMTEKACSAAEFAGVYTYDKQKLKDAERVLAQSEFHDVLSGTAVKSGYTSSLRKIEWAIEGVLQEYYGAVNGFAKRFKPIKPGDDCFIVFNNQPYDIESVVETEYFLFDGGSYDGEEGFVPTLYDEDGNVLPSQVIKEESEIRIDRRKRVAYRVTIPALSVKKIGVHTERKQRPQKYVDNGEDIVVKDSIKTVKINRKTGLIDSFILNGKEYLKGELLAPYCFDDNEDPWGWHIGKLGTNFTKFKLDKSKSGLFRGVEDVTVLEDGDVLTEIQSVFSKGESHIVLKYKIYKDLPYFDVNAHVIWNEYMKGLKLRTKVTGKTGYFAQMAFGTQFYKNDGIENPSNRFVGNENGDNCIAIYNRSGIHASSKEKNAIDLTLLNGSAYCAHPTEPRFPIIPDGRRFVEFIEVGTHDFEFRVGVNKIEECERISQEFNHKVYSNLMFPHGDGDVATKQVEISNSNIVITALKRRNDGTYLVRLFNNYSKKASGELRLKDVVKTINLGKYEFKTFVFDGKKIVESLDSSIY